MVTFEPCRVHEHWSAADAEDCALRAIAERTQARMSQERHPAKLSELVWPVLIRLSAAQHERAAAVTSIEGGREDSGHVG